MDVSRQSQLQVGDRWISPVKSGDLHRLHLATFPPSRTIHFCRQLVGFFLQKPLLLLLIQHSNNKQQVPKLLVQTSWCETSLKNNDQVQIYPWGFLILFLSFELPIRKFWDRIQIVVFFASNQNVLPLALHLYGVPREISAQIYG